MEHDLYMRKFSGMKGKYLLLGSNLGNKAENISLAIKLIKERIGRVKKASSIYQTSSWGIKGQPDYCNQVVQVDSMLNPALLLELMLEIEASMGRIRNKKWDNRIIDIDILFYDDLIVNESSLKIPHPEFPNRKFALVPMAEIAPDEIHPVSGLTMSEMLSRTTDPGIVELAHRKLWL